MMSLRRFPALEHADEDGLLAMGGDLSASTLLSAYAQGIFPWFNEGQPILWWSPSPRLVLQPSQIRISRSLKKNLKKYRVTCNKNFHEVISGCALRGQAPSNEDARQATWITQDMLNAYSELFAKGYAHSIEVWADSELVGGLYGVSMGGVFFGESMFSRQTDASKTALVYLCQHLLNRGFSLIDCQVTSEHLLSLGATEIPRNEFVKYLANIDINCPDLSFHHKFPNELGALTPLIHQSHAHKIQ